MLADNINFLREQYPLVYQAVKEWETLVQIKTIMPEVARDGNLTLKFQLNDQSIYIHSKYNPLREAAAVIDKLIETEDINENTQLVFYGVGMGYHIEEFISRYPDVSYSIIEPSVEILSIYLDNKIIKKSLNKNLLMFQCGNKVDDLYNKSVQLRDKNLIICDLPAYKQFMHDEYLAFLNDFRQIVKAQRSALHTNMAFKKRWIINSVNNLKIVLQTPNILLEDHTFLKDKTAILVAAGPSLDLEIENLKKIKAEGLAYIFSVGTAINTLIENNVYPDAICTYDPKEENQLVFKKINEKGISSIPMIFGSSVGYEVLEQYQGTKIHMLTSQDTVADYFLKAESGALFGTVTDAPSIAIVTLELLEKLEFGLIVLVGQNLAFTEEKTYSSGIDYMTAEMQSQMLQGDGEFVESVDGQQIKTTESFSNMRHHMERIIEKFNTRVINTTIGGAKIKGTQFQLFSEIISDELSDSVALNTPLNTFNQTQKYDRNYAVSQLIKLKKCYLEYQKQISEIKICLREMEEFARKVQEKEMFKMHTKMDQQIRLMEKNTFFRILALPINRVEYSILSNEIQPIKAEQNKFKKAVSVIKPTNVFVDLLFSQMAMNDQIMLVLENVIRDYL